MRIAVLTVGRGGCDWADAAVEDWTRRLRKQVRIEERAVKPERFRGDVDAVRAAEGDRLAAALGPRDTLVVLDERGEDLDTEGFLALIRGARVSGVHRVVFALGGPYGHDPRIRSRADRVVRLSRLVLNHEVARVVLYEQLYRVHTLLAGTPYHH